MGSGYSFHCKKCKKQYDVKEGIGFLYPLEYSEMVQKIKDGKYGKTWQKLFAETPFVAVDASWVVLMCESCRKWKVGQDATLYVPNDVNAIRKNSEDTETIDFITPYDLGESFRILKAYECKCRKCGGRMRKTAVEEAKTLPCPKCGTENEPEHDILWD